MAEGQSLEIGLAGIRHCGIFRQVLCVLTLTWTRGAKLPHKHRNELPALEMADRSTATDGTYASAMPDKPLRPNTTFPGTVSVPEGSSMGVPAGSTAVLETLPSSLDRCS